MKRINRWLFALPLAVGALSVAAGCEGLVGIEDRKLDPALSGAAGSSGSSGAGGGTSSPKCTEYCTEIMASCTGSFQQYASEEACLATCGLLPAGEADATTGNSVECRLKQAVLARKTGEQNVHCSPAGPGGHSTNPNNGCGTNCEAACLLASKVCPDDVSNVATCQTQCAALKDRGQLDVVKDHHDFDNVQCRLVHLSSATLGAEAAAAHCWHGTIPLSINNGERSPCSYPLNTPPECEDYCRVVGVACTGANAVYEDSAQCLAACAALPKGVAQDTVEDTVGCRVYHSYSGLAAPAQHCSHAGPSGDGHCGTENCTSYCTLIKAACKDGFDKRYSNDAACMMECTGKPGSTADSGYAVASADGNNVQCRIRAAVRELAKKDGMECTNVFFGEGNCQ